jgi:hypothetical protein
MSFECAQGHGRTWNLDLCFEIIKTTEKPAFFYGPKFFSPHFLDFALKRYNYFIRPSFCCSIFDCCRRGRQGLPRFLTSCLMIGNVSH